MKEITYANIVTCKVGDPKKSLNDPRDCNKDLHNIREHPCLNWLFKNKYPEVSSTCGSRPLGLFGLDKVMSDLGIK